MNGGKSKDLRGHARMKTTGKYERRYRIKNPSRGMHPHPGTIALTDDCTRKIYQRLKKSA